MFHKKLQSRGTGLNPRLFPRSGQAFSRFEIFNSLIFNTLEIEPLPQFAAFILAYFIKYQTKTGLFLLIINFIPSEIFKNNSKKSMFI